MRKSILSIVLGLVFMAPAIAQDSTAAKEPATDELYPLWQNRHAIALSGGLPGFGLEYAYNLNRNLNLRAGFLAFTFNDFNTDMDISGQSVNVNANLTSTVFDLMLEYQPSTQSSFKLVAGLGYLNNVGVNTLILLNDDIGYGDLVIDNEEIGDIDLTVSWTGIAPYMGFGFGRAVPKKRVGFGIEIGTYYAGGPSVDIDASGMLENTSEEEAELEDNLASYAWMPRLMARLAIKL
ncbi:hypothetical protein [Croceimicrobium sp.]|uniref:hypothetical protein n=1 Tax=Croceimicrobium sp. TaxID=2828340 RepID=UPI003BAB85B9